MPTSNLLEKLPAELVARVFEYIGSGFFRHDVRRVAISKRWYEFARPLLLGHVCVSVSSLRPVLGVFENEEILFAAQNLTKSVDLYLEPTQRDDSAEASLRELNSRLQHFKQLHILSIHPGTEAINLEPQIWRGFLSLGYLTSLTIDLANIDWAPAEQTYHICEAIRTLLPSLKQLHCRLPCIVRSFARRKYRSCAFSLRRKGYLCEPY